MVRRSELPNGLRIVSEQMPGVPSVTVGIWVENGSRFERREQGGISHFLEHLLFKGTERRTRGADRRGDRRGRRRAERVHRQGVHLLLRARARRARRPRRPTCWPTSSCTRASIAEEIDRERTRRAAGDLAERGHAGRLHPRPLQPALLAGASAQLSRSAARARPCSSFRRAATSSTSSPPATVPTGSSSPPPATSTHERARGVGGARLRPPRGQRRAGRRQPPPRPTRGVFVVEKPLEQVHLCLGTPGVAAGRRRALRRLPAQHRPRRRHELAALPGGPREARPRLLGVLVPVLVPRRRLPRHLRRHRRPSGSRRSWASSLGELRALARDGLRPDELARVEEPAQGQHAARPRDQRQPHEPASPRTRSTSGATSRSRRSRRASTRRPTTRSSRSPSAWCDPRAWPSRCSATSRARALDESILEAALRAASDAAGLRARRSMALR